MKNEYHKFRPFEDEDEVKSTKTRQQKSIVIALVVVAATAILVVAVAATTGLVLGVQSSEQAQASGLSNVQNTPGELRGQYNGEAGAGGIIFHITVNESFVFLSITTQNGTLVVKLLHSIKTSMTMFDTDKEDFLVLESESDNSRNFAEYLIPKNSTKMIESMMSNGENMTDDVLQHMDNKTVDKVRQFSLEKLAMSKVALLIIEAAEALGYNTTALGDRANPAARVLYMLAMQLSKARGSKEDYDDGNDDEDDHDSTNTRSHQQRAVRCSSNGATCSSSRCPFRQGGNDCFGMCGKGCSCWSFICGNCCVNQYCLTHDQCCDDRGFFSWACLSVAWRVLGSRCTQRYAC